MSHYEQKHPLWYKNPYHESEKKGKDARLIMSLKISIKLHAV